jgi:hypothetical protein
VENKQADDVNPQYTANMQMYWLPEAGQ